MAEHIPTRKEQLKQELEEIENIQEENEDDESKADLYTISSYGVDYTVEFLVKKINNEQFYIPKFQRKYVWSQSQASRFVESILLGLPVPGIFLFKESDSSKHLVIDGQQRLISLSRFYRGIFNQRKFTLTGLRSKWSGLSYEELDEDDRARLDDGIVHTTVFKQELPQEGMDSVYEVFERINTGGVKLSSQEIRSCVLYGSFNDLLFDLNNNEHWRLIYGKESVRLKDIELILRFFSFLDNRAHYSRPVNNFLGAYMEKNRNPSEDFLKEKRGIFCETMRLIASALPEKAFRPERALNTAIFDSFSVAVAESIVDGCSDISIDSISMAYGTLLQNTEYRLATGSSTAGEESVATRFSKAREIVLEHAASQH